MNPELDAALVASIIAVDPHAVGGVCLRSPAHPARDQWLHLLRGLLPSGASLRRIPFNIPDARLLGGLDMVASIRAGRPIAERGVLAMSHGGVVIISMAERLSAHTASSLNSVLDCGRIAIAREGVWLNDAAEVGIVALDEGVSEDEFTPHSLVDRLAFLLDLSAFDARSTLIPLHEPDEISAARMQLPSVNLNAEVVRAVCATALALGAGSARVTLLAIRVARILAALDGRTCLEQQDAVTAAALVLAPRASSAPAAQSDAVSQQPVQRDQPEREPEPPPGSGEPTDSSAAAGSEAAERKDVESGPGETLDDVVLSAAQASIPAGLLMRLRSGSAADASRRAGAGGRVGALRSAGRRGRPAGYRSGKPGAARLNLIETLRAAAPWQRIRGRSTDGMDRVRIRPEDFRVTRYKQRSQTLTIFAVDASGSSALNRLAETKGAVELLLADCYIRRDHVAVIAFRGRKAELLLPPTRSLVRAKRSLAGLPGGGGTPLAEAIDLAVVLGAQARRRGEVAALVMLTDGRANVARNGATGREVGLADALSAARNFRMTNIAALLIDSSPTPHPSSQELARCMGAQYVPLPFANAQSLSKLARFVR